MLGNCKNTAVPFADISYRKLVGRLTCMITRVLLSSFSTRTSVTVGFFTKFTTDPHVGGRAEISSPRAPKPCGIHVKIEEITKI